MQLPIAEVVNRAPKKAINILELDIEYPLSPARITQTLKRLKDHPEIDTILLVGEGLGSTPETEILNDPDPKAIEKRQKFIQEFSNNLTALLKQTLQITRVIYNVFKITADAHVEIDKELTINKETKLQELSFTKHLFNDAAITDIKKSDRHQDLESLTVSPNDLNYETMKSKLGNSKFKRFSLKLQGIDLTYPNHVQTLTQLCEQFPQIQGLEFNLPEINSANVLTVRPRLSKLLCMLESIIIKSHGDDDVYGSFLSMLSFSKKLKNLELYSLYFDPTAALYETLADILSNNRLLKLRVEFTRDPNIGAFAEGLKNNTSLQSLAVAGSCLENTSSLHNFKFITEALRLHPNIRSLCIYARLTGVTFPLILQLVKNNPSLETLSLPTSSLTEDDMLELFTLLQDNNSLREISVHPSIFFHTTTAMKLATMLEKNFALNSLDLGYKNTEEFSVIFTSDNFITTLANHFPNSSIRELYLPFALEESAQLSHTTFVMNALNGCPRLKVLASRGPNDEELQIDHIGQSLEKLMVSRNKHPLAPAIKTTLSQNKAYNQAAHAISIAEKILKLIQPNSEKLQSYAMDLLVNLLIQLNQNNQFSKLIKKANYILGQFYINAEDHSRAYACFRECESDPAAMSALLVMLYGEDDESFIELAENDAFLKFSKTELLQFYLILLSHCDINDTNMTTLLSLILGKLYHQSGPNASLLKTKFNAVIPIAEWKLLDIAETLVAKRPDEKLSKILKDDNLSFTDRFKLVRAHPAIVEYLKKEYGTAEIICFEDLIINFETRPKTIYNANETWETLYLTYTQGVFSTVNSGDIELSILRNLARKCFTFFDSLYLSNTVRGQAVTNDSVLKSLVTLASKRTLPWLSAFIASVYARKKDYANAEAYYLSAAQEGDYSELENIKRAATQFAPWAISILKSEIYLQKYPELNLFLAEHYHADNKLPEALECYKKAYTQFPERVIEKVQKLVTRENSRAIEFLTKLEPKVPSLLTLLGDHFTNISKPYIALDYYKEANPANNTDALNGIRRLADSENFPEAVICMANLYRTAIIKFPQDLQTQDSAFEYNYQAAKLNNNDATEFLRSLIQKSDLPINWVYLIAGVIENSDKKLAKELFLRVKDKHPIAKLETKFLTSPPKLGEREKILNFNEGTNITSSLERYFSNFPKNKSAEKINIANNIVLHFHNNPTHSRHQALAWLREYASQPRISKNMSGELARMLSCAIYVLKDWNQLAMTISASMKPRK